MGATSALLIPCLLPAVYYLLSYGAHDRNRTDDLFLTKEVLYLLSYVGFPFLDPLIIYYGAGNGIRTRDPQLGRLTL